MGKVRCLKKKIEQILREFKGAKSSRGPAVPSDRTPGLRAAGSRQVKCVSRFCRNISTFVKMLSWQYVKKRTRNKALKNYFWHRAKIGHSFPSSPRPQRRISPALCPKKSVETTKGRSPILPLRFTLMVYRPSPREPLQISSAYPLKK